MKKKLEIVLEEVIGKISPSNEEIYLMENSLNKFLFKLKKRIDKLNLDAEIFVGGSFAKKTLIKKNSYDIDLFLRFQRKYFEKEYPRLSKKILRFTRNVKVIHGSRDYYKIQNSSKFFFELVPVKKISKPSDALNVTDLSYAHVNYIRKKAKKKEVLDGIKLAKAFCYANKTYGAESYVNGFSGYALELLVYHFGSFEKFLRALVKKRKKKLVVDLESAYKKKDVFLEMNGSKLDSPVILVDPTYKERNVLAALSEEKFEIFQKSAKEFLNNPSIDFFVRKKINFELEKKNAEKKHLEFLKLELRTNKEKGDIAGTKLLKFFNHLSREFEKYFEVLKKDFEYEGANEGTGYFVLKKKTEILFCGPSTKDAKNVVRFKKEHKNVFTKTGKLYANEKFSHSPKKFLAIWKNKNKKKIIEMSIIGINSC